MCIRDSYSGEELYGKTVDVRLIDFIRGEKKFSSLDELKKVIFDNAKTAEDVYKRQREHSIPTFHISTLFRPKLSLRVYSALCRVTTLSLIHI